MSARAGAGAGARRPVCSLARLRARSRPGHVDAKYFYRIEYNSELQPHNHTTTQLHNNTTMQQHNNTTAQQHNSTVSRAVLLPMWWEGGGNRRACGQGVT